MKYNVKESAEFIENVKLAPSMDVVDVTASGEEAFDPFEPAG